MNISKLELLLSFSEAVDLISPLVANHQKQVACIAYYLSKEMGFSTKEQIELVFAAALHDIGSMSLHERLDTLRFDYEDRTGHGERGYLLLKSNKSFDNIAKIIRYHHTPWDNGNNIGVNGEQIPLGSHILNLADRVAVLIKADNNILSQADNIKNSILNLSGHHFAPDIVQAFIKVSKKECFWLDSISKSIDSFFQNIFEKEEFDLDEDEFEAMVKSFASIIDFRSPFTATHSAGVAACAEALAQLAGFSQTDSKTMKIAGYIHDLGKLAVPTEILEKPSPLTKKERDIIRTHTYYTNKVLLKVKNFDTIREWGAYHHERLDGTGYPFHLTADELSLGSRIMAVADIFVAISEDRPYRKGMDMPQVLNILNNMAQAMGIDKEIVSIVNSNFNDINLIRINAQKEASNLFNSL